jgi:hypothetical protein
MKYRYYLPIFIFICLFIFSNAFSQIVETKSLPPERAYEPVELKFNPANFDTLYQTEVPSSELFLYAFNSGQGWQPIPYQIDEKDAFAPSNNVIDTTDVLIFLAKDLGDRVDGKAWIANPESQSNKRYEIEIVDPLDRSKKGWCYLFISSSLSEQDKSSIKYISVDTLNDIIMSPFYNIDYSGKWYPENIFVTPEGQGNNQDFYDRTKVRFIMLIAGGNWLTLNEDNLVIDPDSTIQYNPNPVVRLKRKIPLKVLVYGQPFGKAPKFSITYYPYSTVFSGDISLEDYSGLARVKYVRMSYDLNSSATNMKFFSGDSNGIKNQNILIDGSGFLDNADTSMVKNKKNWTMVTGIQGTMLTLNDVRYQSNPPTVTPEPHTQYLYYWDDKSGSVLAGSEYPAENDIDSGDSSSYGDHGLFFESYALTDSLHYLSTTYFIGSNQSGEFAQKLFENFNEPILSLVYITEQKYSTDVHFEDDNQMPGDYRLGPIFPNPFNPTTNITFNLPKNDKVNLQIFDLKGRQIITLVNKNLNAGVHHYTWDGRDGNGKLVSSGIYICVIRTTVFNASQKMVFVK